MASIVSSVIASANPQIDGRLAVREVHIDNSGNPNVVDYMADAGADLDAHLAADAVGLAASLTQAQIAGEVAANLNAVTAQGSVASPTFIYSTLQENAAALLETYNSSVGTTVIMIGDYLNSQTDTTLIAGSGLPQAEIDGLRSVWSANATTAAAIRAATPPVA